MDDLYIVPIYNKYFIKMPTLTENFIDFEDKNDQLIQQLFKKRKMNIESDPKYQQSKKEICQKIAMEKIKNKEEGEKKRKQKEKISEQEKLIKKEAFRSKLISKINEITKDMTPHFPAYYNEYMDELLENTVCTEFENNDKENLDKCTKKVFDFQIKLNNLYDVHNRCGVIMMLHNENRNDESKNYKPFLWDPKFIHETDLFKTILNDGKNFYEMVPNLFQHFSHNNEHACVAIEEIPNFFSQVKENKEITFSFDDFAQKIKNHIINKFEEKQLKKNNDDSEKPDNENENENENEKDNKEIKKLVQMADSVLKLMQNGSSNNKSSDSDDTSSDSDYTSDDK